MNRQNQLLQESNKIVVKNLYKIFGDDNTEGMDLLRSGLDKDEILKQTSMVVGVSDVNFSIKQGEIFVVMGLSGSGKSTLANALEVKLAQMGQHTYLLDVDNVRHGLNRDLGFTETDRVENIRRISEVAKLFVDAGLIVSTAFISPFRAERQMVRGMLPPGEFVEIFVDTPLAAAEARDVKGLYARARRGEIAHFTGISSPYEAPDAPDIRIDTTRESAEDAAERIVEHVLGVWSFEL